MNEWPLDERLSDAWSDPDDSERRSGLARDRSRDRYRRPRVNSAALGFRVVVQVLMRIRVDAGDVVHERRDIDLVTA